MQDWYKNLKDNSEDSINILLGNKRDIIDEDESKRSVEYETAEKFANDNGFLYFNEITCKNKEEDVENIFDVFDKIAIHFYKIWLEKKDKSISVKYEVSDSMMTLGRKQRNKKNEEKKKCC